jgi:hypothetical protein
MYHIAQVNIARLKASPGDPLVAGFFDNLVRINNLAEESKGFVWRYKEDFSDDPLMVLNLSVGQNIEQLGAFVYRSGHAALWWIKENQLPSPNLAMEKLALITELGPTADAFTFSQRFDSPDKL